MASKSRAQFDKRRKELARQDRQKEKRARKAAEKERKEGGEGDGVVEDPDLVGIQLGPQPPASDDLEESDDPDEEAADEEDA